MFEPVRSALFLAVQVLAIFIWNALANHPPTERAFEIAMEATFEEVAIRSIEIPIMPAIGWRTFSERLTHTGVQRLPDQALASRINGTQSALGRARRHCRQRNRAETQSCRNQRSREETF